MRALILAALAFSLAAPASAYTIDRRLTVTPGQGTDFTVNYRLGAELADYWCAAGRYARAALGAEGRARVYRMSPPPQRRGQSISFTLDPAKSAGDTGFTILGGKQDGGFSVNVAVAQNCYNRHIRNGGLGFQSEG